MASIFISHSHNDYRLAERLQKLLELISGRRLIVNRSSDKGAIKAGENWREWINDKVLTCDVAIILLTPASLRGRWVLWEAGAVAGVQSARMNGAKPDPGDTPARRVRVLHFNFDGQDLGPFSHLQSISGLDASGLVQFFRQLLQDFEEVLGDEASAGLVDLKENVQRFVSEAAKDLRYTPVSVNEGLVQDWLARLDDARQRQDDAWIVAAKRWINVAFLGAERAGAHKEGEAIDFRIHMRIADAHRRLRDWAGVVEQLKLAASLSPNDIVVLRKLGQAYRERRESEQLALVMTQMKELDPEIFTKDREAIALRCGYYSASGNWNELKELLRLAEEDLVNKDAYLAFWRAYGTMKADGSSASVPRFQQLRDLLAGGSGFWDIANLVNAQLALGEFDDARRTLGRFDGNKLTRDDFASGTRYYDEILKAFGHTFDWKGALPDVVRRIA